MKSTVTRRALWGAGLSILLSAAGGAAVLLRPAAALRGGCRNRSGRRASAGRAGLGGQGAVAPHHHLGRFLRPAGSDRARRDSPARRRRHSRSPLPRGCAGQKGRPSASPSIPSPMPQPSSGLQPQVAAAEARVALARTELDRGRKLVTTQRHPAERASTSALSAYRRGAGERALRQGRAAHGRTRPGIHRSHARRSPAASAGWK